MMLVLRHYLTNNKQSSLTTTTTSETKRIAAVAQLRSTSNKYENLKNKDKNIIFGKLEILGPEIEQETMLTQLGKV